MKLSWRGALPLVGLLACVGESPVGISDGGTEGGDLPIDGGVPSTDASSTNRCDPTKDFEAPALMPELSTGLDDLAFSVTRDELLAFVGRGQPTVIMQSTRATTTASFGAPTDTGLAAVNTGAAAKLEPSTTGDGLALYYAIQEAASGDKKIFVASRSTTGEPFAAGQQLFSRGPLVRDASPHASTGGSMLYWVGVGQPPAKTSLLQAQRDRGALLPDSRTVATDVERPVVSSDDLTLYYYDPDGQDIRRASRTDKNATFSAGKVVGSLSSTAKDIPLYLSYDGCVMVLASDRPGGLGGFDLYMAKRPK